MDNFNQPITPPQFNQNNSVSIPPKKSKKLLILVALIIVVLMSGAGWFAWRSQIIKNAPKDLEQNVVSQESWKTYTNSQYGFEVKYPTSVFMFDEVNLTLVHKLKNFHSYSAKDGSDLGLATDISLTFKPGPVTCDYLENTLKIQSLGVQFTLGNIKGVSYEMGAEGEGIVDYCIKNNENKNIFAIERKFLNESYGTELSKQSDYIPSVEQVKLAEQILSTFKFSDFTSNTDTMVVKVYFMDSGGNFVSVIRVIPKTEKVATAAINELIKGPTEAEKLSGYGTGIPSMAKLNSLVIVNGEARADFSRSTESGGSSNPTTDQIRKTLLQFPTVKTVILSVDGKTENIFQP
ncbi:MAG: GerMN domain-containing protein [Nanoarchaeota archaeon]